MKVVLIAPVSAEQQAEIAAVDPRIEIEDAWDLFGPELVGDWPRQTTESYLPRRFWSMPDSSELRARRDAVLSDAEGTAALAPVELAAARPDPFCRYEKQWLAHLEMAHPEVFDALARYLPSPLRDRPEARVRPLAVDRCGLRLRVETTDGDHDVRLAWQGGAHTVAELRVQMGLLVGCPFRDPTADRPIS